MSDGSALLPDGDRGSPFLVSQATPSEDSAFFLGGEGGAHLVVLPVHEERLSGHRRLREEHQFNSASPA